MYLNSRSALIEELRFNWQERRSEFVYQLCLFAVIAIVLGSLLGL